ncbi:hypothetical protein BJ508DRAFT_359629 [Ascobolus immersus RN42]|uniref:Uncharacterized protein n=1 Tax=Ascobolus immersus RN42 TaxID=1160509 RepID=A0A3N4IIR7_ASCIM|nr:hypothetical protein BJ508DRAFT_359629 [Ascobolus immersus RN42]
MQQTIPRSTEAKGGPKNESERAADFLKRPEYLRDLWLHFSYGIDIFVGTVMSAVYKTAYDKLATTGKNVDYYPDYEEFKRDLAREHHSLAQKYNLEWSDGSSEWLDPPAPGSWRYLSNNDTIARLRNDPLAYPAHGFLFEALAFLCAKPAAWSAAVYYKGRSVDLIPASAYRWDVTLLPVVMRFFVKEGNVPAELATSLMDTVDAFEFIIKTIPP